MKRGKGHIPDHEAVVRADLALRPLAALPGLVAAPAPGPRDKSYAKLLDHVPNQGGTSSCVGNAMSTSVYLRAQILGHPIPRPSRKWIYDLARLIDVPHHILVDQGCRPTAAMTAACLYGLVSEDRWQLTDPGGMSLQDVNANPPQDVMQHALGVVVSGQYRIASGPSASHGIRAAIDSGYCPIFAMDVDQAYEDFDGGGVYAGVMGKDLGGHMQCVVGYGDGYLIVCNSWGSEWGTGGCAAVADGWFDTGACTDILVPTIVPKGLS